MLGRKARFDLDSQALLEKFEASEIELKVLSNKIGIDVETIREWLNGSIKKIKKENLTSLAKALKVSKEDLVASTKSHEIILNSKANDEYEELFSNLFNINKWNAIPLFINAIVNPSLPAKTQTRLYEFLSILSIFSADFERAGEFSKK